MLSRVHGLPICDLSFLQRQLDDTLAADWAARAAAIGRDKSQVSTHCQQQSVQAARVRDCMTCPPAT